MADEFIRRCCFTSYLYLIRKTTPMFSSAYEGLIQQFLHEEVPLPKMSPSIRFEAISSAVIGSKQRRFGPKPKPEVQVGVREIIQQSTDALHFFVPWGASKLLKNQSLDILEFMALKQLRCLSEELARYQTASFFYFRLEDNTDNWLFGERHEQIYQYTETLIELASLILPNAKFRLESQYVDFKTFRQQAEVYVPVFYGYLTGVRPLSALQEIGWQGDIPDEQQKYYRDAYHLHYPHQDHNHIMAKYFAGTLTRLKLGATARPPMKTIDIAFNQPVPGSPTAGNRMHYRTLPERYTNHHQAPWNGKGYLRINEDNECCPRFMEPGIDTIDNTIEWNGVKINVPFYLS